MPRPEHTLPLALGIRRVLLFVVILFLAILLFLPRQSQEWLGQMGGPLAMILETPLHAIASLQDSLQEVWSHYLALQHVWEDNQILKQKIRELEGERNLLKEQAIIMGQFQKFEAYQESSPMQTTAARIIGRNVSNWYQAMIIDKGTHDGIHTEMGVVTEAGVVGRVVRTNPTTAIVLLLSDPNVAITGMIQTSRDQGIIQGTPQGNIKMKYLPPLSPVQPGDEVVTSGLTDDFPRGLYIGRIQQVTKAPTDLFQSAEIDPVVDFSKLEGVLIITSFQTSNSESLKSPETSPHP